MSIQNKVIVPISIQRIILRCAGFANWHSRRHLFLSINYIFTRIQLSFCNLLLIWGSRNKDRRSTLSCSKKFNFSHATTGLQGKHSDGNQIHVLPYSGLSGTTKNRHGMCAETIHCNVDRRCQASMKGFI